MRKLFFALPLFAVLPGCNVTQQTAACDLATIGAQLAAANAKGGAQATAQQAQGAVTLCPAVAADIAALAVTTAKK